MAVLRRSVRMGVLLLSAGVGLLGGRTTAAALFKHLQGDAIPLVNVAHADVPASGGGTGVGGGSTDGSDGGDGGGDSDCDGGDGGGDCDGDGDGE